MSGLRAAWWRKINDNPKEWKVGIDVVDSVEESEFTMVTEV